MKKFLLSAAVLCAAISANAIGFDYTSTSIYKLNITDVFTNLVNCKIEQTAVPATDKGEITGKNSIVLVSDGDASVEVGGITFSWNNKENGTMLKQYGNYIQPNGSNRVVTIPTKSGDKITINVKEAAAGVTVTGADVNSIDLKGGDNELTASGSAITLTIGSSSKPKFKAITGSSVAAIVSAETSANVVETYYMNLAGQKMAAPVQGINIKVQVLDNGEKKVTKMVQAGI